PALHEPVQLAGGDDRLVATAGLGQAADGQRADRGDALERAHDRAAGLGLALGTDRREPQRVDQWVERFLVVAGIESPAPELRIAPPEPLLELLAPRLGERVGGKRLQQLLGALKRRRGLGLTAVLHAQNRLRGELADLAAERAGDQPAESGRARG